MSVDLLPCSPLSNEMLLSDKGMGMEWFFRCCLAAGKSNFKSKESVRLSVCNSHISMTVCQIYVALGRFAAEFPQRCRAEFGDRMCRGLLVRMLNLVDISATKYVDIFDKNTCWCHCLHSVDNVSSFLNFFKLQFWLYWTTRKGIATCLSVVRISQEPHVRSASHLACLLMRTQGSAV